VDLTFKARQKLPAAIFFPSHSSLSFCPWRKRAKLPIPSLLPLGRGKPESRAASRARLGFAAERCWLLVELKRWVAKEATDRGQILDDAERTTSNLRAAQSRSGIPSVARAVARYGYLVPKLTRIPRQLGSTSASSANETPSSYRAEEESADDGKNADEEKAHNQIETAKASMRECAEATTGGSPADTRQLHRKPEVPNRPMVRTIADSVLRSFVATQQKFAIFFSGGACTSLGDGSAAVASDLTNCEPSKRVPRPKARLDGTARRQRKQRCSGTHEIACKDEPVRGHTSSLRYVRASFRKGRGPGTIWPGCFP